MNQKTKEIAEFDGWAEDDMWVSPDYLTDLNALHRVALDVMDRLSPHRIAEIPLRTDIQAPLLSRPINGQYTDLVDAVYDAIVYLKKHDLCQPK
jgi:hypothetical protein